MSVSYPPEAVTCPDPGECTVAIAPLTQWAQDQALPDVTLPAGREWFRVHDAVDGCAAPTPGYGNTRFAPFDDAVGKRVPTLYLADSLAAALLGTALHDLDPDCRRRRYVAEASLHGKHHAHVIAPSELLLVDLRDPSLSSLGLGRAQVATSHEEHYSCTRQVAKAVHASPQHVSGILWHSRQAELTKQPPAEIAVVFGDRVTTERGTWKLVERPAATGALLDGYGRALLDEMAAELDFSIQLWDLQ